MDGKTEKALKRLPTPCYVIDERALEENCRVLSSLQDTGCRVLLAQKAFSCFALYPLIGKYLSGTTASGLYEARLGKEEMGKENHVFAPAYKESDMREIVNICDHIVFNSAAQYRKYRGIISDRNKASGDKVSIGLRINPMYSTRGGGIYDPCAAGSRLGITPENFIAEFGETLPEDIEGLHFHTLCEQDSDALIETFAAAEKRFAPYLKQIKWLNMGGGHHITRKGYKLAELKEFLLSVGEKYGVQIYLEPGEAVALNAGYLVTGVEDIVSNGTEILVLDASAECHMPDVLEMPYRPPLYNGYGAGEKPFTYRLSSLTCLAGDVIGDYSFEQPVRTGDKLIFEDMAIYTMVKNNTFNGIPLPSIYLLKKDGSAELVRRFGYDDFKGRLS